MRAGDLVRFRECTWHVEPKQYTDWKIGLVLEYKTWEKVAKISYKGRIIRVRASDTQLHQQAKRKRNN